MNLIYNKCPVCNSDSKKVIGKSNKINDVFKRYNEEICQVQVVECKDCNLVYLYPRIQYTEDLYSEMYNIGYFSKDDGIMALKNMPEKRRIINKIANMVGDTKGKKILDIGCGTGEYLVAASENGFDVTGIDVDKSITDYVSKEYGFNVINTLLKEGTFEENSFDVVVLSHVIEHLEDPNKIISTIYKILKPEGLFLMLTPNVNSFADDFFKIYSNIRYGKNITNKLTPFVSPYHILGFNMKSSKQLLKNMNFKVVYAQKYHGLDWEEYKMKIPMKVIKFIGLLINKGVEIVIISRK